jgi:hypothetical protein
MKTLNTVFLSLLLLAVVPLGLAETHKYSCSESSCVTKKHRFGAWHDRKYKLICKYQPTSNENTEQTEGGDTSDADTDDEVTSSSSSNTTSLYFKDWDKASGSSSAIQCTKYASTSSYVKLYCFNPAFSKKDLILQWTCSEEKSSSNAKPVE